MRVGARPAVFLVVTTSDDEIAQGQIFALLQNLDQQVVVIVHRGDRVDLRQQLQAEPNVLTVISVSPCGGSAARNVGIRWVAEFAHLDSLIGFPDDDCVVAPGTLRAVASRLEDTGVRFLLGRYGPSLSQIDAAVYPDEPLTADHLPFPDQRLVSCSTMYCRLGDLLHIGGFVEQIGIGAAWEAGEENDLVTRLLRTGARGVYLPEICVFHPYREREPTRSQASWIGLNTAYASVSLRFAPTALQAWAGLVARTLTRRQTARTSMEVARSAMNPSARKGVRLRFREAGQARRRP